MTQRSGLTFAELVGLYHDQLKLHARARVRSAADAEDITQETWLRAAVAHGDSTVSNARAYLHRIAANLAIDHIRHRALRRRLHAAPLDGAEATEAPSPEPSVEQVLIDRQRQSVFETIIAELPDRCRQALVLSRLEGWTHARIAAHLGVSPNTVTSDIRRALAICLSRSEQFDV
ncbi:MAG TPA: RNA polymerase sigma factor [Rhodopila sp.]